MFERKTAGKRGNCFWELMEIYSLKHASHCHDNLSPSLQARQLMMCIWFWDRYGVREKESVIKRERKKGREYVWRALLWKRMRSRCSSSSALFILSQLMSFQKAGYVIFYSSRKNIDFEISNQHPQSRRELPLLHLIPLHWALCLPYNDQIKFNQINSRYISNFFFSVPYSMCPRDIFIGTYYCSQDRKTTSALQYFSCVVSSTNRNPN